MRAATLKDERYRVRLAVFRYARRRRSNLYRLFPDGDGESQQSSLRGLYRIPADRHVGVLG